MDASLGSGDFWSPRNESTRIDVFDELGHIALAALRSFFRRLGAPHLVDEVILPTLQEGDSQVYAAVRDRPWPPWGLGARHVTAVCQVQEISDESYSISPVYVTDEDATNVGMIAALYKEVLEALSVSERAEVTYIVADGSKLADHVLGSTGFKRYDDVVLTEQVRYYTYRIPAKELLERLGLAGVETPDLLSHQFEAETLTRNALFHSTILAASRAEWTIHPTLAEIIKLVRGGHAGKPGGVPAGTGRWGWRVDDPINPAIFVSLENFLGDENRSLLEYAVKREGDFGSSTVVAPDADEAQVDERFRRSKTLDDLGDFGTRFEEKLKEVLEPVLSRLEMEGFAVGPIEMQLTASGDGDYFRMHRDADETSTRALSFVYFFHGEPRRFSGGELRIFDNETVDGKIVPTDRSQTLSPRQDLIVFFPSHNEHELLPVRVPTKEFGDSRFTLNGWIHRAK
jgi:hypothetical protein